MQLTEQHRDEFDAQGYTIFDGVFGDDEMAAAEAVLDRLHADRPKFIPSLTAPSLMFLLCDERLEQIAKHVLRADEVVHTSNTSLFKPIDEGQTEWQRGNEHVDIQYSLEEMTAVPRQMTAILIALVSDLPEGRANTFVRPGSQHMLAEYLAAEGKAPYKDTPTVLKDLPDLDWPEPIALTGKRGQVIATTTALIHAGSNNVTNQPRQMIFSNFCPLGLMSEVSANRDRWADRDIYRAHLKELFPPDRQHLLRDRYLQPMPAGG